ncbi:hypothetical protein [Nocardia sp. NPDC051570]|uniref:hypothetical protein n=1 Tax=Nocardia sp. NPDC051570 TaxID=3364324 RepID=UPI0037AB226E
MDEGLAKHILDIRDTEERDAELYGDESETAPDGLPLITSSAGYSIDSFLLLSVCDLLQQLITTLIAVNMPPGKSPPKVKPMQRPVSALDREKAVREQSAVDETLSEMGF